jgi:hypothetical protein
MFESVPWAVGGGAEHSADAARTAIYAATGGAEGVAEAGDLKVSALATAGPAVRIAPGAVLIPSRASGAAQQTYTSRNVTETEVPIAATGSAGGRSDLIVVMVKDPYVAGSPWSVPTDPAAGPYVEPVVIPNVAANVTKLQSVPGYANHTGYAIARVDIPASTATITGAMVKDLRKLATPRSDVMALAAASTGAGKVNGSYVSPDPLDHSTFATWPDVATWQIQVPAWATEAVVTAQVFGAATRDADVWGETRIVLGTLSGTAAAYDVNADANPARVTLGAAATLAIPSAMRGTTQTIRLEGRRSGGTGHLTGQDGVFTTLLVNFKEGVA